MLANLLIAAAVLVAAFVVVVLLRPSAFRVERSATIAAPPAIVFEQVNTLRKWEAWSPWAKLDPQMTLSYDGPPAGTGAVYSWIGNSKVGEGRMTIVDSRAAELVRFKLEFFKPFAGTNTAEFTFRREGDRTIVTWTMFGESHNFICKAMSLLISMDKMVGGQFAQGLAEIKRLAEGEASQSLASV